MSFIKLGSISYVCLLLWQIIINQLYTSSLSSPLPASIYPSILKIFLQLSYSRHPPLLFIHLCSLQDKRYSFSSLLSFFSLYFPLKIKDPYLELTDGRRLILSELRELHRHTTERKADTRSCRVWIVFHFDALFHRMLQNVSCRCLDKVVIDILVPRFSCSVRNLDFN